jgi:undecaprenyl-diphosphatase
MKVVTLFGSRNFLVPVYALIIVYYLVQGKRMLGLHIALVALSGTTLSFGLKRLFQRARPDLPLIESLKTYSFPSGHSLSSIVFCSILVYLLWRSNTRAVWKWIFSVLLFSLAVLIGISRVILKVHYPTDVLAGFCLGFAWVIASFYLLGRIKKKSTQTVKLPF